MVNIIVDKISPRLEYTCKQIFKLFLNTPYKLIVAEQNVEDKNTFCINYSSNENQSSNLRIIPNGLLSQTGLSFSKPDFLMSGDEVKLFVNDSPEFGFDLFAATFWMLSRYEEYDDTARDNHNRFSAKNSFAFKHNFLSLPVVDIWIDKLRVLLNNSLHEKIPNRKFNIINTIDVDNAFAYKGKDLARKIGAFSRDLLKGKLVENKKRRDVLTGKEIDPYDTYAYIKQQTVNKNIKTIFFHLVGEKSKHDRNIKVDSEEYKTLLSELKQWAILGLHPSYLSNSIEGRVKEEKGWLESSSNVSITSSRQHFLMMTFPKTYNTLIQAGIENDYSMGYADEIGFRAGTSQSFTFFDLVANEEKKLLIHPFCLMDGTLRDYLKLSPSIGKEKVQQMLSYLKKRELNYTAIWHNETLSETNGWEGWREVYESQFI